MIRPAIPADEAAIAGLHYQSRQEERFLEQTHGDAYRSYRMRVARYLS